MWFSSDRRPSSAYTEITLVPNLFERMIHPLTLHQAWRRVRKGHGRGQWTRTLSIKEMEQDYERHIALLSDELRQGNYRPEPVHRFEVTKSGGGTRRICAFAARDKLVQRAALTVLEPLGEWVFHPDSLGYRPLCTIDMALARLRDWVRQGHVWLGQADIVQCFDEIPRRPLLERLKALCGDQQIVSLVRKWFAVSDDPRYRHVDEGMVRGLPQGMVLSPFLCNLYLHELDMELDDRGIPFVRYADDFVVFGATPQAARQALIIASAVLQRLGLALHPDAVDIVRSSANRRFLGKRLPNAIREYTE